MDGRRMVALAEAGATGASRRRLVAWGTGATVAALGVGFGGTGGAVSARLESTAVGDANDLDAAIERMRAATAEFIAGKPEAWKAMCSHAADATIFGGWGGHEQGWAELGPRYDWASARFAGGEVAFEELARHVSGDLAGTVHLEQMRARLAGGDAIVPVALQVSQLYRREEGGWKLLHRHADPVVEH